MVQVGKILVSVARLLAPLTKNTKLFAAALGILTAAFVAYKVALVITTIASWGLSAATLAWAGVIVLIVAAIVGIAVALVYAYRKFGWFRAAVDAVWKAVKVGARAVLDFFRKTLPDAIGVAIDWIRGHWKLLVAILAGPFGLAVYAIYKHFDQIKHGATAMVDWITRLLDFVRSIPSKITGALKGAGGVAGKVLGAAGKAWPFAAEGAHVTRSGGVVVGERGPELLSLPAGATVAPLTGTDAVMTAQGGFGELVLTTQVVLDRRVLAQSVGRYTADKLARR
jgi:phage-related protein